MKKYLQYILVFIFLLPYLARGQAPPNDLCGSAIEIEIDDNGFALGVFESDNIDITEATKQIGEFFHDVQVSAGTDKKSIWFSFYLPTSRAIRVELLQPDEDIAQNGAGFTIYKANSCFPGLNEITEAKLTPLNKFGNSYNPCLLPGHYLIQVSAKQDAEGEVFIKLTSEMPDVLNSYTSETESHFFGTIGASWNRVNFDVGCLTIKDEDETCEALGDDYQDYTQSAWFVFRTGENIDLLSLRIGEQNSFFTGNMIVGFNIYEGDVREADYETFDLVDGCNVFHQTSSNQNDMPKKTYICSSKFDPETYYSLQVFFHKDYMNSVFVELFARGKPATLSPNPSNIHANSKLGILPNSPTGITTTAFDRFSCNAFIADNVCGDANPASGIVDIGANSYNMSTWYSFEIDDFMNIRFQTNSAFGKRLFFGDIESNCNLEVLEEFTSGNITFNCMAPGTYSIQLLSRVDTSYSAITGSNNGIGLDANLSLHVVNNSIAAEFLLDDENKVDFVNSGLPLLDDITYTSTTGRFNCQKTVLPEGDNCFTEAERAMYRQIIIGDATGDGFEDEGVLTLSGGNFHLRYLFYEGDANSLAVAQNSFSWGDEISGLQQLTTCSHLYYSSSNQRVCVRPGDYTLVSYGRESDVGRTDNPRFRFNIIETSFGDPNFPDDMGDITSDLYDGNVSGTIDYFSCIDNPLTIAGQEPCLSANKQIYRQFYIDEPMILNFSMSGGNRFRIFYGKISDGIGELNANIPGVGNLGCRSSYNTNVCNPLPAGWYTIVSYGEGGNYDGPQYFGGVTGLSNNITISRVNPPNPTNYHLPSLAYDAGITDWGPNTGSDALPVNSRSYTFGSETFNCSNNLPLLIEDCEGYNRQAFYVFEITKESYLSFTGIPTSMKAQIYSGDVRDDYDDFPDDTPIQACINISSSPNYHRIGYTWNGRIDLCKMQPGVYTLIVYANDSHINQSVTPSLYVDNIEESRFDFAVNAYDFGVVPDDNIFHWGKEGDVPLVEGRAASNDFFSCLTGAYPEHPSASTCWSGSYPIDGQYSVQNPMPNNTPHYTGTSTNTPIRRNLWYTFVIDGPGLVSVRVVNKTSGKTTQNPFAIYHSNINGELDFYDDIVPNDVDSTISQGLSLIRTNSTYDSWGCAGNQQTVTFEIDPCDDAIKQRYYIVVDQHVGIIPNSQIEVAVRHEAFVSLESLYDDFADANLIGAPEIEAPYTDAWLEDGQYEGDPSSFACATKEPTDQNSCGTRTLWYKFNSSVNGKVRIAYEINEETQYYNSSDIILFREIIPDNPTEDGLEMQSPISVNIGGQAWGENCLLVGTYYIMLTGCSYTIENVKPLIWIVEKFGDNCVQAVPIVLDELGSASETVTIDCHEIGQSFGEDGSNMGCLYGPEGYKSTWFKVNLNFEENADVTFQLSENTTALPHQIRYRVLYGTCNSMTAGPCNTDALTTFTLNCMLAEQNSYYVQVVMPENTTGDITLTVNTIESPSEFCVPFDPLLPIANFTYENTCVGDLTCFTNQSSQGSDVSYLWNFDIDDETTINSTDFNPCYTYPAPGTYNVQLTVTTFVPDPEGEPYEVSSSVIIPVTIYHKPDPNITRDPSDFEIISGTPIDFFSNVSPENIIADPPTSYLWDLNNGDFSSNENPEAVTYDEQNLGLNTVHLTVTNGTCSVTTTEDFMIGYEPIFFGGFYDGSTAYLNKGYCPLEEIFTGGFYDGASFNEIVGYCPLESIFAGGFYDGTSFNEIVGYCPLESIFIGGFYDGSALGILNGECGLELVFYGGFFDGAAMAQLIPSEVEFDLVNQYVCSGENVIININDTEPSSISLVRWYYGTNLIPANLIEEITEAPFGLEYEITASTTISVVIYSDALGDCDSTLNYFNIYVAEPIVANAGEDATICIGDEIVIGTPEGSFVSYLWDNEATLNSNTTAQPIATPTETTIYCLTVTDNFGVCPPTDDCIEITVDTDKPEIFVTNGIICNDGTFEITVSGTEEGDEIIWIENNFTFTNCGAIGNQGPTQVQADSYYEGTSLEGLVDVIEGIQQWTVPETGTYRIEAYGAQGSTATGTTGGLGAYMSGDFELTEGEVIHILVGQNAPNTDGRENRSSSGGGGSFVTRSPHNTNESILVIAGGGGGTGDEQPETSHGSTSTSGQTGSHGSGGTDGDGGTAGTSGSGAGGGFFTDGSGGTAAANGKAYVNGGLGGNTNATYSINGGGFGGGGSVTSGGNSRYAGGGGYSGGSSSSNSSGATSGLWGGGGGSYNSGTNQENESGVREGHGLVIISKPSEETLTVSKPGIYTVEVHRGQCVVTETAEVIQIYYPAGENTAICSAEETVVLGIPEITNATYEWSPATNLSATDIAQPIANPLTNITYNVTVTHPYGTCIDEVDVFGPISVDAGEDIAACLPGTPVNIEPDANGNVDSWCWFKLGDSGYRLPVTISNSGSTITNYQVKIEINTSQLISDGKMKNDCGDLRVFDADGTTPIDYWIVDGTCNSQETEVWVKVPEIESGDVNIYFTYGYPDLNTTSNGDNVFEFFDDFNETEIDDTKWDIVDNTGFSLEDGELKGTNTTGRLASLSTFSDGVILETKTRLLTRPANGVMLGGFWLATNNNFGYLWHPGTEYISNNGWVAIGATVAPDTYLLNISAKNSTQVDYSIKNIETGTIAKSGTVTNTVLNEPVVIGRRYDDANTNQTYETYWDWIYVRKYVDSEPIVQLGSEISECIAETPNYEVSEYGTYIVLISNDFCSHSDTVVVYDALLDLDPLAWRTKSSGNWNQTEIWQVLDNGDWVDADTYTDACGNSLTYPTYLDYSIRLRTGHTVYFNIPEAINDLIIESDANLIIQDTEHLQMVESSENVFGAEIVNNGTIQIDNGATLQGVGIAKIHNYGRIDIAGNFNVAGGNLANAKLVNDINSVVAYTLEGNQAMWNGVYGILEADGSGIKTVGGINTRINNSVEFMGSKIQLDNRNIRIAQNATIVNGSYENGFFITDASGTVIKEGFGSSSGVLTVPVGHSHDSFNKLDITNTGESDNFRFRVAGSLELTGSPDDEVVPESSVERTWHITNDNSSDINIDLTFYWVPDHESPAFESDFCFIGEHDNSAWFRIGPFGEAQGTGSDYQNMHYYSATSITDVNAFAVGSCIFDQLDYRTISDGDWTNLENWEVYNETLEEWVSPLFYNANCGEISYPSSLSKSILIRHNITYNFNIPEGINSTTIDDDGVIIVPESISMLVVEPKLGELVSLTNFGKVMVYGSVLGNNETVIENEPASVFEYYGNEHNIFDCRYANLYLIDGSGLITGSSTSVYEVLDFNNSKLLLNNNDFTLEQNAIVTNASQENGYIVANDDGYLIVEFPDGENVERIFHVGGELYSPARLTFDDITTAGSMFCNTREVTHPAEPNSIIRYWTIDQGTLSFTDNYELILNYKDEDLLYTPGTPAEELAMIEFAGIYNNGNWTTYAVGSESYFADVNENTAIIVHNSFSDFTLLSEDIPLPVTWLYLTAYWDADDAVLNWVTGSEINNEGFEVQRFSETLNEFETIGFVEGAGNSSIANQYSFTDENLRLSAENDFYFRLKQIDFDGAYNYSTIISLSKEKIDDKSSDPCSEVMLFPNPVSRSSEFNITLFSEFEQTVTIRITNTLGSLISVEQINISQGLFTHQILTNNYYAGVYFVEIQFNNCSRTERFVVID